MRTNKKHSSKYKIYLLILSILSFCFFAAITEDVIHNGVFTKFDSFVNTRIILLWNPILNNAMIFITNIAGSSYLLLISVILIGILVYKKRWRDSFLFISALAGGLIFEFLIKFIMQRARPENALIHSAGYSFPSGHAIRAIIFFSFLIYCFKDEIKNKALQALFIAGNIIMFILIGFSRIYLNVHWLSDVLAGFALGLFWLTFLMLTFQ